MQRIRSMAKINKYMKYKLWQTLFSPVLNALDKVCVACCTAAKLPEVGKLDTKPSATTTNNLFPKKKDFSFRAIKYEFIFNTLDY